MVRQCEKLNLWFEVRLNPPNPPYQGGLLVLGARSPPLNKGAFGFRRAMSTSYHGGFWCWARAVDFTQGLLARGLLIRVRVDDSDFTFLGRSPPWQGGFRGILCSGPQKTSDPSQAYSFRQVHFGDRLENLPSFGWGNQPKYRRRARHQDIRRKRHSVSFAPRAGPIRAA
jgi:hypothetical protein